MPAPATAPRRERTSKRSAQRGAAERRPQLAQAKRAARRLVAEPLELLDTPEAVVLGLVYTFLPFMILPIYSSVEKLDSALIEAALDLGGGRVEMIGNIIENQFKGNARNWPVGAALGTRLLVSFAVVYWLVNRRQRAALRF